MHMAHIASRSLYNTSIIYMHSPRPYASLSLQELNDLAEIDVKSNISIIRDIIHELSHRKMPKARNLHGRLSKLVGPDKNCDTTKRIVESHPVEAVSLEPQRTNAHAPVLPLPHQLNTPAAASTVPNQVTHLPARPNEQRQKTIFDSYERDIDSGPETRGTGHEQISVPASTLSTESATPSASAEFSKAIRVVGTRNGICYIAGLEPIAAPSPELSLLDRALSASPGKDLILSSPDVVVPSDLREEKALRIFEFVRSWRDLTENPIQHTKDYQWTQTLRALPRGLNDEVKTGIDPEMRSKGIILQVRRPASVPEAPVLPGSIRDWIQGNLSDWQTELGYRAQRLVPSPVKPGEPKEPDHIEDFSSNPIRVSAWSTWLAKWLLWARDARQRSQVVDLYTRLFAVIGLIEGRSHEWELTLGSAVLDWRISQNVVIRHPLLMRRVSLEFDSSAAEITIRDTQAAVEFANRALANAPIDGPGLAVGRKLLVELKPHPLDEEQVAAFLHAVLNSWFASVDFEHSTVPKPECTFSPMLFLRPAGSQVGLFVDRVIDQLKGGDLCPEIFHWLTAESMPPAHPELGIGLGESGTPPSGNVAVSATLAGNDVGQEDADLFFTKAANKEQRQILRLLQRQSAIVVQGPPGTGKTHTIGNLIGHFLALGWRVLVTSQTSKALGEVRNQVAEELQTLCVPLLDADREGREVLQRCLNGISNEASHRTPSQVAAELKELVKEREGLIERRRDLRRQLIHARRSEIDPIVVAGVAERPVAAAKALAGAGPADLWIPGPLAAGSGCPLTQQQLHELYATQAILNRVEDFALGLPLPEMAALPTSERLTELARDLAILYDQKSRDIPGIWKGLVVPPEETLAALQENLQLTLEDLSTADSWRLAAIEGGAGTTSNEGPWFAMITAWRNAIAAKDRVQEVTFALAPDLGSCDDAAALVAAREIEAHLKSGGKIRAVLSFLSDRKWKIYLEAWKVKGKPVALAEHFNAIATLIAYRESCRAFAVRFTSLATVHGLPDPKGYGFEAPEMLKQYLETIIRLVDWMKDKYTPLVDKLKAVGINVPALVSSHAPIAGNFAATNRLISVLRDQLLPAIAASLAQYRISTVEAAWNKSLVALRGYLNANPRHPCMAEMVDAWSKWTPEAFQSATRDLAKLLAKRDEWVRRQSLLARLESTAPGWLQAIRQRHAPHDVAVPPAGFERAWQFRQWEEELVRRHAISLVDLNRDLQAIENQLPTTTSRLVQAKAWGHQLKRLSGEEGRALNHWADVMRKLGAGTGKMAPDLQRAAQRHAGEAMLAVPVWIMPIWRVFQTILPDPKNRFDVVIIDEASQADLKALPVLYLGKRLMVVGDDQQVTPSAVGQNLDDLKKLQGQWLGDFKTPELFDGRESLYSIVKSNVGVGVTGLREHFRCVPDIIAFSNQLCYLKNGNPLRPLRDGKKSPINPAVVAYQVAGSEFGDKINIKEAQQITALLGAMLEHPSYVDATFGVICLVGDQQAMKIDELIRRHVGLSDERIEEIKGGGGSTRRLCGKPPDFQGDERDVILLSMVDSPKGVPLSNLYDGDESAAAGPLSMRKNDTFTQRFNVAASRARNQMWLVHSLDPSLDLQAGDLRRRLIEHCRSPGDLRKLMLDRSEETDSPFEVEVLQILMAAGYKVIPQYPVGALRIDLLVTDGRRSLAVECDGDRFHGPERLIHDMERQRDLERMGHTFHRIRGSAFYRHREQTVAALLARVVEHGIEPSNVESSAEIPTVGVTQAIIARAQELMIEWGWVQVPVLPGTAHTEDASSLDPEKSSLSRTPNRYTGV